MKKTTMLATSLALMLGVIFLLSLWKDLFPPSPTEPARQPVVTPTAPPADKTPAIIHPVPELPARKESSTPPLPTLDESDSAMAAEIRGLSPESNPENLFILDHFIRRLVLLVDTLPKAQLAANRLPVRPVGGSFQVTEGAEQTIISPDNYQRYAPFVRFVEGLNSEKAVDLYVRFYPLFQQAYRDMGYPDGTFNDRLIEVIDHLVKAPTVAEPIRVTRHVVRYRYTDPDLEALSAGRKILLRIGPQNALKIKSKLSEIRGHLVSLPRT
ncbi:DUF3014 domain-containing protein [Desulfuromonas sp. AOP6]|uniref:DUF3014 domain-containing protein n=1 Tax=Desulfuromonas sp. AOP6 TaxID=1566351 RepID=UPI00127105E5|nr:DUF3014 domain-containing protein [Desulfuromonas sp. AOP6]BCA79691.1 hypothetical protein AOP6_1478 [Desulfuromonas sp. AOP6]